MLYYFHKGKKILEPDRVKLTSEKKKKSTGLCSIR